MYIYTHTYTHTHSPKGTFKSSQPHPENVTEERLFLHYFSAYMSTHSLYHKQDATQRQFYPVIVRFGLC